MAENNGWIDVSHELSTNQQTPNADVNPFLPESVNDFLNAGVHGFTFGGDLAVSGAGNALVNLGNGKGSVTEDFLKGWKDRQESLARSEERSPIASTAGGLAGAVAMPFNPLGLVGAAGLKFGIPAVKLGEGVVGKYLANSVGEGLAGKIATGAANTLGKIPELAAKDVIMGAENGAINSKGIPDLDAKQVLADTIDSAKDSTVTGLLMHGGGAAIKGLVGAVPEVGKRVLWGGTPLERRTAARYNMTRNGEALFGTPQNTKVVNDTVSIANDTADKLKQIQTNLGKRISDNLDEAWSKGHGVDAQSDIPKALQAADELINLSNQQSGGTGKSLMERLQDIYPDFQRGDKLNPNAINTARQLVRDAERRMQYTSRLDRDHADTFNAIKKTLDDGLSSLPEGYGTNYAQNNKTFGQYLDILHGSGGADKVLNPNNRAETLAKFMEKGSMGGAGEKAASIKDTMFENLQNFENNPANRNPISSTPDIDLNAIKNRVNTQTDRSAAQGVANVVPLHGGGSQEALAEATGLSWRKAGLTIPHVAAKGVNLAEGMKNVVKMPIDKIGDWAVQAHQQMLASGAKPSESITNALSSLVMASKNNDVKLRDAAIFSLLQQPDFRKWVDVFGLKDQIQNSINPPQQ